MAGARKLQAEVDRTLKQIGEHIAEFDTIWDKVQSAPTPNLKEKYEADLKREIKKLQRLRDSCKVFIAQHEVKNKVPLVDVRKAIEEKMEQFKVLEKQTKTKAYSKEGLAAIQRQRPAGGGAGEDEKREEVKGWLDEMSEALQGQYDEMEQKLETAKETGNMKSNKKKTKGSVASAGGESVEDIQRVMDRQQFHLAQIELIKERLDDEGVTPDEVEGLRDGLENYVQNHLEAEFEEDEALYDELDLTEPQEAADEEEEDGAKEKEDQSERAASEEKDKEAEVQSPTKGKQAAAAAAVAARPAISVNTRTTGVIQATKTTPTAATTAPTTTAAASATKTSPPVTAASTPITRIVPNATPPTSKPALSITPLAAAGKKAAAAAPAPVTAALVTPKPMESMASIVMKGTGKADEQKRTAAGAATVTTITPITSITPIAATASASKPPLPVPTAAAPLTAKPAAAAAATAASRVEQGRPPLISPVMKINTSAPAATSSATANTAITPTSASQPASATSSVPSFHSPPVSPAPLPITAASPTVTSLASLTAPPSRPSSSASINVPDDSASIASSVATVGSSVSPSNMSSVSSVPPFDPTTYPFAGTAPPSTIASSTSPTASTASTTSFSVASPTPSAHRDRGLIPDDYFSTMQLLDASLHHFPQPSDTDRPKPYTPRNPYRTPPYFPSTPPAIFDDPQLFSHLTVDTLFFIFYFQQGTPHQYLAARELKKQSWRYHKNFLTWFQRHDDPKLTSDEYETGTYVYFDYESGWCQRIKAEFTFEYRHLECEDIEGIASQVTQFGRA